MQSNHNTNIYKNNNDNNIVKVNNKIATFCYNIL